MADPNESPLSWLAMGADPTEVLIAQARAQAPRAPAPPLARAIPGATAGAVAPQAGRQLYPPVGAAPPQENMATSAPLNTAPQMSIPTPPQQSPIPGMQMPNNWTGVLQPIIDRQKREKERIAAEARRQEILALTAPGTPQANNITQKEAEDLNIYQPDFHASPTYKSWVRERESGGQDHAVGIIGARGRYQFMPNTWAGMVGKVPGLTADGWKDPVQQEIAMDWFTNQNRTHLKKVLGRDPGPVDLYLGHWFGAGGASRIFQSDPNTPLVKVLTRDELKYNPWLVITGSDGKRQRYSMYDLTVRDMYRLLSADARRMLSFEDPYPGKG